MQYDIKYTQSQIFQLKNNNHPNKDDNYQPIAQSIIINQKQNHKQKQYNNDVERKKSNSYKKIKYQDQQRQNQQQTQHIDLFQGVKQKQLVQNKSPIKDDNYVLKDVDISPQVHKNQHMTQSTQQQQYFTMLYKKQSTQLPPDQINFQSQYYKSKQSYSKLKRSTISTIQKMNTKMHYLKYRHKQSLKQLEYKNQAILKQLQRKKQEHIDQLKVIKMDKQLLQAQIEDKSSDLDKERQENIRLQRDNKELRVQNQRYQSDRIKMRQDGQILKKEKEKIRIEYQMIKKDKEKMLKQMQIIKKQMEKKDKQYNNRLSQQQLKYTKIINQKQSIINRIQQQKSIKQDQIMRQSQQILKIKQQLTISKQQQKILNEKIILHKKDVQKLKNQNQKLNKDLQQLKNEVIKLKKDKENIDKICKNKQLQIQRYKKQISDIEASKYIMKEKLNKEIQNQQEEINKIKSICKDKQAQIQKINNYFQNIGQQLNIYNLHHQKQNFINIIKESFIKLKYFRESYILNDDMAYKKVFIHRTMCQFMDVKQFKTKLVYRYDPLNTADFHNYFDYKPNLIIFVKLVNNTIIGGFTANSFDPNNVVRPGKGILFSITEQRVYKMRPNPRVAVTTYDKYFFLLGNAQIRIRTLQKKVFSNFGVSSSTFEAQGQNRSTFLNINQGDKNQVQIISYQIYELLINQ